MRVEIVYKVIPHGKMAGLPAIWVRPAEEGKGSEWGFSQLLQHVIDSFTTVNMHLRILVVDVVERQFSGSEIGDITQLLDWAIANNVTVVHYIDDSHWPSYARMGGLIKMHTTGECEYNLPSLGISEVYWWPQSAEDNEPEFNGGEAAAKYVVPNAHFSISEMYRFLSDRCKGPWAIALPHTTALEVGLNE